MDITDRFTEGKRTILDRFLTTRQRVGFPVRHEIMSNFVLELLRDAPAIQTSFRASNLSSWLRGSFQDIIFPRARDLIDRVLHRPLHDEDRYEVTCHVEGSLWEYLGQEFGEDVSFEDVFTISEELDLAWGTRVRDYMAETWKSGQAVCNILQTVMRNRDFDKGKNNLNSSCTFDSVISSQRNFTGAQATDFSTGIDIAFSEEQRCKLTCHYDGPMKSTEHADIEIFGDRAYIAEMLE